MKFKANVPNTAPMTPRQETQMKYNRSRANLLLVIICTVVNLFTVTFSNTYFLFSATIPMLFPYTMAALVEDPEFMAEVGITAEASTPLIITGLVIGLILVLPYLLCWIFSKKRVGWMIASLVFFSIDCLFLLLTFDTSIIIDLLIHAWVMFYLVTGVINGKKLKGMPEDELLPTFEEINDAGDTAAEGETSTEDNAPAFDESLFEVAEEKTEPVAARTFDEIMAENKKDDE